jgi:hypothetical protein
VIRDQHRPGWSFRRGWGPARQSLSGIQRTDGSLKADIHPGGPRPLRGRGRTVSSMTCVDTPRSTPWLWLTPRVAWSALPAIGGRSVAPAGVHSIGRVCLETRAEAAEGPAQQLLVDAVAAGARWVRARRSASRCLLVAWSARCAVPGRRPCGSQTSISWSWWDMKRTVNCRPACPVIQASMWSRFLKRTPWVVMVRRRQSSSSVRDHRSCGGMSVSWAESSIGMQLLRGRRAGTRPVSFHGGDVITPWPSGCLVLAAVHLSPRHEGALLGLIQLSWAVSAALPCGEFRALEQARRPSVPVSAQAQWCHLRGRGSGQPERRRGVSG